MARDKISDLYERHKAHPRGRNSERHPAPYNEARYDHSPPYAALHNNHAPDPANSQHHSPRKADGGSRYLNDVSISDWKRNGDATSKPSFDKHTNSWRSESKGNVLGRETIKDRAVDHNRHHTEFELKHN